ncbi:phosphate/phosphite/phosphonate ABC transporter substrate-binding protein [Thiomicrorhabdus sp. ZW0627]|uniref:phosphate/phosphite/phosphonate ABC transporter substrate-binding protein n=1 Tax=Thiomicrorhabdus sp. ZW0627 TaxID=3039774 RepID=UPI00243645F6|nr:phosphate/phosphite/phosphonate ABC transporter substrate-binding protein [Thiomicrorhabdus sp. ZW0627]MDG6773764.1 phosphate/phosphite/phosphonate ABC transporter substrate-binding protein [Thiomicrorhabdus sp. ZW0627]
MKHLIIVFFISLLSQLSGCSEESQANHTPVFVPPPENAIPDYTFAVHPLHNPTRLFEVFQPLMEYLNARIPEAHFKLEASRNYKAFDNKLKQEKVAFALPNPYQTLIAIDHDYKVIAKMGDDQNFKGIILVQKNSGIKTPIDLKGKSISYPAPTALAATMLPQYYLQKHGLNISKDIENHYVGSQESSIMNVYRGDTAAGSTWPPPWEALTHERPEIKDKLKVIWETQSLPNNSIVVRKDIPEELARKVQNALTDFHKTPEGIIALKRMHLSCFEKANDRTYQSVRDFINDFSRTVRPL